MSSTDAAAGDEVDIAIAPAGELAAFWKGVDRDWRSDLWNFRVVWHEQQHDISARANGTIVGALRVRIAASLGHIEALYVAPPRRKHGVGRELVKRCEELANYYNCHKVSAAVFAEHGAQRFFEACGYKTEAVLAQHTFKLDVAMMRKFLL